MTGLAASTVRPLMTAKEVAEYCAVSERTVREWLRTGELRSVKIGGVRRIDPTDLDKFVDDCKDGAR